MARKRNLSLVSAIMDWIGISEVWLLICKYEYVLSSLIYVLCFMSRMEKLLLF